MASIVTGRLTTILDAKNSDLLNKIKQSKDQLKGLGRESVKTSSNLKGLFKGIAFTGFAAGIGLVTKKIFQLGTETEKLEITLQSLLGSDVAGSNLLKGITELANVTPFTATELAKATKTLVAFGVEGSKVVPTLRRLGDVAAGTGVDINQLATVFGQIRSTGRLMGQDLNQLINAGFNPLQVIAEKTGRSVSDLKDDMSKGLITFDAVEDAFVSATSAGGKFFNLMERQSNTVSGQLSTLKGNLEEVGKNLFNVVAPALTGITKNLAEAAKTLSKVTAGEGTAGQTAAVGAGVGAIGIGGAVLGASLVEKLLDKIIAKSGIDFSAILPRKGKGAFGAALGANSALLAAGIKARDIKIINQGLKAVIRTLSGALLVKLSSVFSSVVSLVTKFGAMGAAITTLIALIAKIISSFDSFITEVGTSDSVIGLMGESIKMLGENITELLKAITPDIVEAGIGKTVEALKSAFNAFAFVFGEVVRIVEEATDSLLKKLSEAGVSAADFLTGGKLREFLDEEIFFAGAPELLKKRAEGRPLRAALEGLDEQIAADLEDLAEGLDVFPEIEFANKIGERAIEDFENSLDAELDALFENVSAELDEIFKPDVDLFGIKRMNTERFLERIVNLIGAVDPFAGVFLGKFQQQGFVNERFAPALLQGSVAARSALLASDEQNPQNKIAKNTNIIADLLQILVNNGVKLQDVGLAQ